MKKTIYKIHKWSGLTLGFFIFLLAISGVSITFREELLPRFYPGLFRIQPGADSLPLITLYERAHNHLKGRGKITNLYSNHESDEAWIVLYKTPGEKFPFMMTINPFTGKIVGEMSMAKNFFALMLFMHANFFLGKIGQNIVGLFGLLLIFFILSGIYVWLPRKKFREKLLRTLTFGSPIRSQNMHHFLGVLFTLPLLLSAATGFLTVFDLSYKVMRPLRSEAPLIPEKERASSCSFDQQKNVLDKIDKNATNNLISVHFCTDKNGLMKISYGLQDQNFINGYGRLVVDPLNGDILQKFDSSTDPSSWNIKRLIIFPMHSGEYWGINGKIFVFAAGVGLILIWISGLLLFLRRLRLS